MKKIAAILLALVIALSMCEAVVALDSKTIYREKGVSAYAEWVEESSEQDTYTFLSLTETDDGTDIYLVIYRVDPELGELLDGKWGYKFTTEDVFDVDNKLTTAILSPVEIDLYDLEKEEGIGETITIKAQWTGVGDLVKNSFKTRSKYDDFMSWYSDRSEYRDAIASGFMNDLDLGVSDYGELVEFKYAEMWMEK